MSAIPHRGPLTYAQARPRIRSGDLLAWTHHGFGSWYDVKIQLVRAFTRSKYCHVGLAWALAGRLFVLEAVQPRIRIYPLSKLVPFYWQPLRASWDAEAEAFALECVGEAYSEFEAVLAGLGLLERGANRRWQCAEWAIAVLERAGVEVECEATPAALVDFFQDRRGIPPQFVGA